MARPKDENGCTIAKYQRNYAGTVNDDKDGDLLAIADIAREAVRNWKPGRARTKYENSPEGLETFRMNCEAYFTYVQEVNTNPDIPHKLILDVEGLCCYLGISRYTLREYLKRGTEWAEFINLVKQGILAYKMQAAQSFRTPTVLSIFDLCNNYGFVNASEFKLSQQTTEEEERDTTRIDDLIRTLTQQDHDQDPEQEKEHLLPIDYPDF